jgi:hypothetical protein
MYKKLSALLVLLSFFMFSRCGKSASDKKLESKEKELQQKEQYLNTFEQQLKARELEVRKRERLLDSLKPRQDSTGVYNPRIVGTWNITMECTETTCEGSAIGDKKTEQWNITYESNRVVARATVEKRLVRVYTGLFVENSIQLTARQNSDTETHIDVTLSPHPTVPNTMEGQRIINQGGKCKIIYQLKAEKL